MKNSPACVHVLHKTLNLVISGFFLRTAKKFTYQSPRASERNENEGGGGGGEGGSEKRGDWEEREKSPIPNLLPCHVIFTLATKLLRVALKLRERMKNSPACVHVLHKTLNLVISGFFAEDSKEIYVPNFT